MLEVPRLAGIFAEPAAATSVAAAHKLRACGVIGRYDTIVCNLGHGLKQPEAIQLSERELARTRAELDFKLSASHAR